MNWRLDALCAQTDPAMFFQDQGGSSKLARKICDDCPVTMHCLQDALATGDIHGVRGGLSGKQRARILVKIRAAA